MRKCPKCKTTLEIENIKFCYECGAKLDSKINDEEILVENIDDSSIVKIKKGYKYIGEEAFYNKPKIKKVIIPEGVIGIDSGAFEDCINLEEVELPNTLKYIDISAFAGCKSLKNIKLNEGLEIIGDDAFCECESLNDIIIPSTVKYIKENAFLGTKIKKAVIPSSVKEIGENAFYGVNEYIVEKNNKKYCSYDGNLYSKDMKSFISYAAGKGNVSFYVPEGVEYIEACSFNYCKNLLHVAIPSSVKEICQCAFEHCSALNSVTINEGVKSILAGAFDYCNVLSSLHIPKSVSKLECNFFGCNLLMEIYIAKGKKYINTLRHLNVIEY